MAESRLKKILAHLPVFEKMPDSNDFRESPVEVCEFAMITEKTSLGQAYYPYNMKKLVAVIGRSPESTLIYFTPNALVNRKGVDIANGLSYTSGGTHSIPVDQIKSYEPR